MKQLTPDSLDNPNAPITDQDYYFRDKSDPKDAANVVELSHLTYDDKIKIVPQAPAVDTQAIVDAAVAAAIAAVTAVKEPEEKPAPKTAGAKPATKATKGE